MSDARINMKANKQYGTIDNNEKARWLLYNEIRKDLCVEVMLMLTTNG